MSGVYGATPRLCQDRLEDAGRAPWFGKWDHRCHACHSGVGERAEIRSGAVPVGPDPAEIALRRHAPLFDAYLTALDSRSRPFTIPGHKHRATVGRVTHGDVPLDGGL